MRLRTVIFGTYVVASAIGLAVLMRFMLAEVRPRYVTAVQLNLEESARFIAAALEGRSEADAVKAASGRYAFRVQVIAADGRVLAKSVEDAANAAPNYKTASARGYAKVAGERLIDGGSMAELEVTAVAPLHFANGATAKLMLSRSFRSVNAVIWSERKKLLGIAIGIAAIMVVAGWWLTARLTASLERLATYARAVRDGRAASPESSRVNEIADLARAFEEMRDALEGRQHVERYTQALAHEVKAPLAAIRGAAELLEENMPPAQREKFIGNIRGEAARIQTIIERLLELSSLEARKALRQTEAMDAAEILREAMGVVRPAFVTARVTLRAEPCTGRIHGERVLLREALVNLLQNALDFSSRDSTVTVRMVAAEKRVTWSVEDEGPGVPDYALPRVFERFYSLPRPGTTRKSTGLGLALVREIAHLHGGEATLENRPEQRGARATLSVPR